MKLKRVRHGRHRPGYLGSGVSMLYCAQHRMQRVVDVNNQLTTARAWLPDFTVYAVRATTASKEEDPFSGDKYSLEQLTDGINECYKDFRNGRLPLDECYLWAVRGIQGDSDADGAEKYLEDVRKIGEKHQ
jgi:hypothetical protein